MKALVIGQGGREHALARALRLSPSVSQVHAVPGSEGMSADAQCHAIDWRNQSALEDLIAELGINFVVIGPEVPLVDGLADRLRAKDIAVLGPNRDAAQLEGSKIYCKEFLREAGVPTARAEIVTSVAEVEAAAERFPTPYVLKADGLAAGKGVFICKTRADLIEAARDLFERKVLGTAGERALMEEFAPGYEISYLVLTNGDQFEALPLAQDHKRLLDGDEGPNTGGMGVVAPVAMDPTLRARIDELVIAPTMALFKKRGYVYRGVLFVGLMVTDQGPNVLEFNTRFGDPETQAILPLLDGDWGYVFADLTQGTLKPLKWHAHSSCCVVLAAQGYPDAPVKGARILAEPTGMARDTAYLLHAGTSRLGEFEWATAGGRVLNAVGLGSDLETAIVTAYSQARAVHSEGLQMRGDIGAAVLARL